MRLSDLPNDYDAAARPPGLADLFTGIGNFLTQTPPRMPTTEDRTPARPRFATLPQLTQTGLYDDPEMQQLPPGWVVIPGGGYSGATYIGPAPRPAQQGPGIAQSPPPAQSTGDVAALALNRPGPNTLVEGQQREAIRIGLRDRQLAAGLRTNIAQGLSGKPPMPSGPMAMLERSFSLPGPESPSARAVEPTASEAMNRQTADAYTDLGVSDSMADLGGTMAELSAGLSPGVGTVVSAEDARVLFNRGDYGGAALAAVGAIPFVGAGITKGPKAVKAGAKAVIEATKGADKVARELPMDKASRMARSIEMGYSDVPFFRGESTGVIPRKFPHGAYFSRVRAVATGFAKRGGRNAPEEYRLNLGKTFSDIEPLTAASYARLVAAARKSDPKLASVMVDQIAPGKGIDWFLDFAKHLPDETVARSGALVRYVIEQNARKPETLFIRAGYDALDSGRDVLKLTGKGIRSKDAKFDPAKAKQTNIMASLGAILAAGGIGAASYPNSD